MQVIKRFKEKPELISVCWKCHSVLHIEFRDLKVMHDPLPDSKYPQRLLHDLHYRCPVCKTVQGGDWKALEIPWQIHDKKIREAQKRFAKLNPEEQRKKQLL